MNLTKTQWEKLFGADRGVEAGLGTAEGGNSKSRHLYTEYRANLTALDQDKLLGAADCLCS